MKLLRRLSVFFLVFPLILLGCSQPAQKPPPEPVDEFSQAKQVVYDHWEAMNRFDAEGALSYFEPSYREQKRERIYSEISQMQPLKAMNYKLTITEMSEPVYIEPGKLEIRITLKTPIGNKYLLYHLVKVDGEWKIVRRKSYEPTATTTK